MGDDAPGTRDKCPDVPIQSRSYFGELSLISNELAPLVSFEESRLLWVPRIHTNHSRHIVREAFCVCFGLRDTRERNFIATLNRSSSGIEPVMQLDRRASQNWVQDDLARNPGCGLFPAGSLVVAKRS